MIDWFGSVMYNGDIFEQINETENRKTNWYQYQKVSSQTPIHTFIDDSFSLVSTSLRFIFNWQYHKSFNQFSKYIIVDQTLVAHLKRVKWIEM